MAYSFKIIMLALVLITGGCVTTRNVSRAPLSVPLVYQPQFQFCYPVDNEATLNVFKQNHREFSSLMVWNISGLEQAAIQFNSHVGDTIFQVEKVKDEWKVTGKVQLDVHETSGQALSINGYNLPVLASEIGCILSGGWPNTWLNWMIDTKRKSDSLTLSGSDELRDVEIVSSLVKSDDGRAASYIKSCAVIKWGGFWGLFKNSTEICRDQNMNKTMMRAKGIGEYTIEWEIPHDS